MAEYVVKFLFSARCAIGLVFIPQRRYPIERVTPSAGAKIHGVLKK